MGYYVQQHMREISIRMALGGSRGDVAKLVVGQGMAVVIGGVIAGTMLAFAATRLMSSLLFGVGATDPIAFTSVAALMVMVALLAVRRAGLARDAPATRRSAQERITCRAVALRAKADQALARRSFSTSTRRRIFPDGDLGIASTNSTWRTRL